MTARLSPAAESFSSLNELLQAQALELQDKPAYLFLHDGEEEDLGWSYRQLEARARAIGALLQSSGAAGERALLLYPSGLEFVAAFLGCLYGGTVAVPTYPPGSTRSLPRLSAIVKDARPRVVLTCSALKSRIERLGTLLPGFRELRCLVTDEMDAGMGDAWIDPGASAESLAFLQYTSGATASPKGVMVSHGNLLHNEEMIRRSFEQWESSVIVTWLPLYHDMGLIGGVLQPLYAGARCILMSPGAFLQKPRRWLEAISRYQASTSGGPNFAYELCVKRLRREDLNHLDLASWKVAFNGSEPVRAETLERFAKAFEPCGFRPEAFYPCYGLAEATLFVTGGVSSAAPVVAGVDGAELEQGRVREEAPEASRRELVGCGRSGLGQEVVIVDPDTGTLCSSDQVGEIWVSGANVAQGYWSRPEATEKDFRARLAEAPDAGPYLRTGDLGFFIDGELFVTGRLKDLIILRGRNLYPQDVELTAERAHPALRLGSGAAFSVDRDGEERLVVAHEVDRHPGASAEDVAEAVRRAVTEEHEAAVHEVVLLKTGTLPKTSSGKVRRRASRAAYLAGELAVRGRANRVVAVPEKHGAILDRKALLRLGGAQRRKALESFLRHAVARAVSIPETRVDLDGPLTALGLDSLAAAELQQSLEERLGLSVPLSELLAGPGLSELAKTWASRLAGAAEAIEAPSPARSETAGEFPLAHGQRALWFLHLLSPESAAYNLAAAMRVRSAVDTGALRRAVAALVERHGALRSTFRAAGDEPLQRVHARLPADVLEVDASTWSRAALAEHLHQEAYRPFDLETGPLLRVRVLRRGPVESVVLVAFHHIVVDFWSLALLGRELGEVYALEAGGQAAGPQRPAGCYRDYVDRQLRRLSGDEGQRLWAYWRRQLAGAPPVLELPTDRPRPPVQTYRGAAVHRRLGSAFAAEVNAVARSQDATLFMTLLAAFQALLHRYTGQKDLVVGSPTAGRGSATFAGLVGYLVNPVALRSEWSERQSFRAFLERSRQSVLGALEHQHYPLSLLAERLHPERDASRSPLFQAMFVFQRAPLGEEQSLVAFALGEPGVRMTLGNLVVESLHLEERTAQFDLALSVAEVEGALATSLRFNTDLFDSSTVRRMLGHFQVLLAAAVADAGRHVAALPLLRPAEAGQLLAEWSGSSDVTADVQAVCLHQLFEAQAERTPEATALVFAQERVSYGQLNARANRLAHYLRSLGVGPEACTGVLLERSPEMVAGLLGILKAGGAYVPLDPAYPRERLTFMLEDAAVTVLLSGGLDEKVAGQSTSNPSPLATARNLAYVIYTSGSTGRPKGVAVEHKSPVTLLRWARQVFSCEELSRVLASTSICFDLSIFELFVPLSAGGTVVLVSDALELATLPGGGGITLVNTVPSAMAELVRLDALPVSARTVNLAGEPLRASLARRIHELGPARRLFNLYGPSEDTTYSTFSQVPPGPRTVPSIGRPVQATRVYLLDGGLRPVPAGIAGQLCLAGEGLARGYLSRPGVTAERFVPDPFGAVPGARCYETGDLAKWSSAGCLEFLGRADHQVKVRGYRIELGEVESVLTAHPAVREAAVLPRGEGSGSRLAAYVVSAEADAEELRGFLASRLPDYMLPAVYDFLEALPLTPNGKVDRAALARRALPEGHAGARSGGLTAVEELVASTWEEVLGLDRVGRCENFFELGGHSLVATRVVSRLGRVFGVELPLSSLFEAPTVAALAAGVESARRQGQQLRAPPILPAARPAEPPLSFGQERLWFLDQLEPGSATYVLPGALRLRGALSLAALAASLREVERRHEVLRTTFDTAQGRPFQVISPAGRWTLPVVDLGGLIEPRRGQELARLTAQEARRPFDLGRGPLVRATLLRLTGDEHRLVTVLHHIIADGWSLAILVREIAALYTALVRLEASPLSELPIQYADFAHWQVQWLRGEVLEQQLSFWREVLARAPGELDLPADRPRAAARTGRGSVECFELRQDLLPALSELTRQEGVTLFMALLAAFEVLLYRYAGQAELTVGTPVANRNRLETEGLIGFFVNTLVLFGDLSGDPPFRRHLARVREAALQAYAHQELPFERLVEELQPERSLAHSPLFQVMFTFGDTALERLELPGLILEPLSLAPESAKFDLTLSIERDGRNLSATLEYDTDLFDASSIVRLAGHFSRLLAAAVREPGEHLSQLPLLSAAEHRQLVVEWNDSGRVDEVCDALLPRLFEARVGRSPESVAVVLGPRVLSYAALESRANQLARHLRHLGVGPEVAVGLCVERSPEIVVGLLGILKAQGACVPLDPAYPEDRLRFMLRDARIEVLVTRQKLLRRLPRHQARVLCLDRDAALVRRRRQAAPAGRGTGEQLAYVIYTSGSTGEPKAVGVSQGAARRHFLTVRRKYDLGPGDRVLQFASISFDVALEQICAALLSGAQLWLRGEEVWSPGQFSRLVADHGLTVVDLPTAYWLELARELSALAGKLPEPLRLLLVGGEAMPSEAARLGREVLAEPVRLVNAYGPTEAAITATVYQVDGERRSERQLGTIPIGLPLAARNTFVFDRAGRLTPIGVPGELHLGGMLARGYLRRPAWTAEKFVPNPFHGAGTRLYRTGDLVRWLPEGCLGFLGRIDRQVKIRGFRIEPGEVEAVLATHPGWREAVVVVRQEAAAIQRGAEQNLVAFGVAHSKPGPAPGELRRYLQERLPAYMVPAGFVELDALPLTPGGKVDRKALGRLPLPASESSEGTRQAPQTPVEELVAAIWTELIGALRVGRHDNFFELGGHSLLATRVSARLRESLGVDLPVRALFEAPTVAALGETVQRAMGAASPQLPPLEPVLREGPLPVSFAQERLWFLHQLEPESSAYNVAAAFRLQGRLSAAALRQAFNEVVRRHEALRTSFAAERVDGARVAGLPVQVITPSVPLEISLADLSGLPAERRAEQLERLALAEARRPFDLVQGPLLRVGLARLERNDHGLLVTQHHIVSDGWSMGVLVREIAALYEAFAAGRASPLPELPVQYADFAVWQRTWLRGEVLKAQLRYWQEQLAAVPALNLPTDRPRPARQGFRGSELRVAFGESLSRELGALSRSHGATLYMTLLAGFQVLLSRITGQRDLSVGTAVANRGRPETEGLIGFFVNTLVLRGDLTGNPSFEEHLARVRARSLGAYAHQDLPFERLVEALQPERDLSRSPLFQVMFILQNAPMPVPELAGLDVSPLAPASRTAKFDLTLSLEENGSLEEDEGALLGSLEYDVDLFDSSTLRRLARHLEALLQGTVAAPCRKVEELPLLAAAERGQLLWQWNDTRVGESPDGSLHQLFEVQAGRTPDATALVFGEERLSYLELNAGANRLARRLRALGVGPEVRAGILLERSAEMVVGLLAILKAGGVYVPLDPAYPPERLAFMLRDARVAVLLSRDGEDQGLGSLSALKPPPARVAVSDPTAGTDTPSAADLPPLATSRNLAYVIYTSGSTGRPKGVAIEHRSPMVLVRWARRAFAAEELAAVLAATSICFDLSVFELFVPLASGGTVILAQDALELPSLPAAGEVTLVNTVPSAMAELVDALPPSVRTVNLAGEPLQGSLVHQLHGPGPDRRVLNLYGPTEDTTYSTAGEMALDMEGEPSIGRPVAGTRVHLLDATLGAVPVGVAGQLYLAGSGLARGYQGRPGATARRFLPDPFGARPGGRLYETGDLSRWTADGRLGFLGRIDHQVKVRGFRIELGEVEAVLTGHDNVRQAVVLMPEEAGGSPARLVAYVTARREPGPGAGELRRYLRGKLPGYMVPAAFTRLESLPQTANGKVDRMALSRLSLPATGRPEGAWEAPHTPLEELVAGTWAELLGARRVGRHDNFFELGGHSLLATRVLSRLRRSLEVDLPVRALFEAPTVAALSETVRRATERTLPPVPALKPVPREGALPLSFAQERLWFLDQLEPGSSAYNMPAAFRLRGRLSAAALRHAFDEVARRHEAVRTSFMAADADPEAGSPLQVIAPSLSLRVAMTDLSCLPAERRGSELERLALAEARRPFDLARGPLLRVGLARLGQDEHGLLVTMHHIVSDGWSMGVLVREVAALYNAFAAGRSSPLAELPVQYADFAAWQRTWLQGEVLGARLRYWQEQLAGVPALNLPTDRPRPARQGLRGSEAPAALGEPLSGELEALSRRHGATLYMTLLAAFQALLCRTTGQRDLSVGSPVANRGRPELEGLIGFFVNTLVLRADLAGDPSFEEHLARVRDRALGAYAHQDVPFERLVEALQPERDLSRSPLFQVMFVLQNAPRPSPELDGLTASPAAVANRTAKFDLTLSLEESERGLVGSVEYDVDLFDRSTVRRLVRHLETLLAGAVAAAHRRVAELPLLGAAEQGQLRVEWNDTRVDESRDGSLHQLFEAQVGQTPDATALIFGAARLTYLELNARANRLAHYLRTLGVGPEVRVGILLERSAEMVVGLLGSLKAGGVYVPLDPAYPPERSAFVLRDARVEVLLGRDRKGEGLDPADLAPVVDAHSAADLPALTTPRNLAYVIYTSGSTGTPKGVAVEHRSPVALVRWALQVFAPEELSGVLAATSICFDLSVFELFVPLASGGTVILVQDALELPSLPAAGEVTLVNTVPSAMAELVGLDALPPSVYTVNLAGEPLQGSLVRQLHGPGPARRVFNLYGPTEDTTYSTAAEMALDTRGEPSIGRPVAGTRVHLLDATLGAVPVGVAGQLYLAGSGLARGYLGRPGTTARRFLPDPFGARPGGRLYETGDLGRWSADGRLGFLGRIDHQVKVRGFRIELGEIEAVLTGCDNVREAAVLVSEEARPAGDRRPPPARLVAYVAARREPGPGAGDLRRHLREKLPGYMVPAAFMRLESLPRTPNGKLDRTALSRLSLPATERPEGAWEAPRTPLEELVAGMWAELLSAPRVSRHDNFFELGGHSLLATRVLSRLRRSLEVDLPVRALFEAPTVAALALAIEEKTRAGSGRQAPTLRPRSREDGSPLSFAQERLWFLDRWEPGSAWYNVPAALRIRPRAAGAGQRLDLVLLRRCLDVVVRRHETLRTRFEDAASGPVQRISPPLPVALPVVDLEGLAVGWRERVVRELAAEEARRSFDLARGPLLRTTAVRLTSAEHMLLVTFHHIAADGWSMGVLIREVAALLTAFSRGTASPLAELSIQYADFAVWQRRWLSGDFLERQVAYWRHRLADLPVLELPTDRPRPSVQSSRGASRSFRLPEELSAALAAFSRREGATLFMTLLAAFQALLCRYTGQADLSVGTPVAGREPVEVEGLIGCFVNTLVLRTDLAGDPGFRTLLGRVREAALEAYRHQEVPFERLVEELQPDRVLAHPPLYQVMLVLQNVPAELPELAGLTLEPLELESDTTKFDLTLFVEETARGIAGRVVYNRTLFVPTSVARLVRHWAALVTGISEAPERRLSELPLLAAGERHQLRTEWNATDRPLAAACFQQVFEAQAERVPDASAVVFEEHRLSYGELDRRADRLAHRLRELGVGPDVRVGLCVERSAAAVTGLLGILKAGGAYVPLDPRSPSPRLAFMLADSGAALVLSSKHLADAQPRDRPPTVDLDEDGEAIFASPAPPMPRPASAAHPVHLAYVIYTSGSTGRPKGVGVEHRQVLSYVRGLLAHPEVPAGAVFATVSSLAADLGNTPIFAALATGGTLHVIGEERLADAEALAEYCRRHPVDGLKIVPSHLAALLKASGSQDLLPRRCLILGGEAASWELIAEVRSLAPGCHVLNHYGPTEATVGVLTCLLDGEPADGRPAGQPASTAAPPVPIGRPMAQTQIYLADSRLVPVPLGIPAEGYLGGVHLARGYLGHPRTTAERFLPDPFGRRSGMRLYRTGDRLRYRADGRVEFLGRVDHQVKIRGFRVEPGEVESVLLGHPGVREAAVLARREGVRGSSEPRLVAYVVGAGSGSPEWDELRRYLQEKLPQYMVPAACVALETLPLTPNGKVDRAALNRRDLPPPSLLPEDASLPRTPAEEIVAGIWSELLGIEGAGREDDFFELGGHSLLVTQAISRVRAVWGRSLPLRALFEAPTVAAFAERVERQMGAAAGREVPPLRPVSRHGDLPLSFAQERLWFLDQLSPGQVTYNVPAALRLHGRLSPAVLDETFRELVRRHEVLRTSFVSRDGKPLQVIAPRAAVKVAEVDLVGLADARREPELEHRARQEARRPFDLARGPLLRLLLLRFGDEEHALLMTMHHVVSDGWSVMVLVRELTALYRALAAGEPSPLPELAVQYADFSQWQREWLAGETLAAGLAYWREQLAGLPPVLELPTDRRRPAVPSHRGARRSLRLTEEVSDELAELSRRQAATLFMVLLAAFQSLLSRYTGQADLVVGFPVANRDRLEIEGLIGFFVNLLPLRADLAESPSFREHLARVREVALTAYAHQEVPFEKLLQALGPDRNQADTPLLQVTFALQTPPLEAVELPDLVVQPLDLDPGIAKFDLSLIMAPAEHSLEGTLEYSSDLFDATTVQRLAGHLEILLEGIAADPGRCLAELPLLSRKERLQLVVEWNDTRSRDRDVRCVHELCAAWAERAPDVVAVAAARERLSYRQLDVRADQLARYLGNLGVGPETVVGVYLERSPEMIVALLGILKAGGAYVPIDPAYPAERVAFVLEDTRAPVLLTRKELAAELSEVTARVVLLGGEEAAAASPVAAKAAVDGGNLAYVIYTSGSTGRPKGVQITHRSLLGLVFWHWRVYSVTATDRASHLAGVGFDASVWEIWPYLAAGASLFLPDEETRLDPARLADWLAANGITLAFLPTPLAEAALTAGRDGFRLRYLLTGGDRLRFYSPTGLGFTLVNHYGPSETTVVATAGPVPERPRSGPAAPPIGRPIANTTTYLLDRRLRPVPIGVVGEISIGGAGVARGYLERPALTAERFLPDPFTRGARLYRTGDLARYLPDGNLEFRGRVDTQVKVRGYRIELGEVEALLGRHPKVRETVAAVHDDGSGNRRLIAYVVPGRDPEARELRAFLQRQLPDYMVPSAFIFLADLPLTRHGKVDRQALLPPEAQPEEERVFVAPRTPVEESLVLIWSKLLNLERVGVHDDFFEAGGHSLLATQLVSQVRQVFKVDLPLRSLFQARTVADMALVIVAHETTPGQTEKIARMLKVLKGMSADEVGETLKRKRSLSVHERG